MDSLSPPLQNPRDRGFFPLTHLVFFVIFIFSLNISITAAFSDPFSQIPYYSYCNDVVPQVTPTDKRLPDDDFLHLRGAHISPRLADRIPGREKREPKWDRESVTLDTQAAYRTQKDDVFMVVGVLRFQGPRMVGYFGNSTRRRLRLVHIRPPKFPVRRGRSVFRLGGFWSSTSGKLCMVGSGVGNSRLVDVTLKLNYRNSSNIFTCLVNGSFESSHKRDHPYYFDPISILGVSRMSYKYTLIDEQIKNGVFSVYDDMENISLGSLSVRPICSILKSTGNMYLEYGDDCNNVTCNPLQKDEGNLPVYMSLDEIECLESGKVRYVLAFANRMSKAVKLPFDPSTMLVAEGAWNGKKRHLDMVACRIGNETDSSIRGLLGDCLVGLSLRIPATWSLRNRSDVVGKMWINNGMNKSSHFNQISLRSTMSRNVGVLGLKYKYTEDSNVRKYCEKRLEVKVKKGKYPSSDSSDMRFHMVVKNKKNMMANGFFSPVFVGDKFYEPFGRFAMPVGSADQGISSQSNMVNVSYAINFESFDEFRMGNKLPPTRSVEIYAEGIYNRDTGTLCMIGCRHLAFVNTEFVKNNSMDCEILVNVQYSPLNTKGRSIVKGTIDSTRSKLELLYFEPLDLYSSSIYTTQAHESIWRMDLETAMVLISNTLACLFVVLQLFYVRKHSAVLPSISLVLLLLLTLAHMIPLLLNFEAMFLSNHNRQNLFLGNDGWLEVNEVLVRVITMIAFLLQLWHLHLAYSARTAGENHKNLWICDKKVLYLSLPLYIGGCLIAWFSHLWSKSYQGPLLKPHRLVNQKLSFLGALKSSAGLVLDSFLLPQILFNLFSDTKEQALAPPFYIGTTVVRLLPHAYDLYRAHSSSWNVSYIYANPRMNYYSTAWDIIISCAGLLFAFIIYLQQRFGGCFFLPTWFRGTAYEKVPAVSNE